jgi:synaptic vesicle membrane protein VAT-1
LRAVVVTAHGPPDVIRVEERPDPAVPLGHVRIAVRAAGVNFADLIARSGLYPDAPPPPFVPGYEVAGEVDEVGPDVEAFSVGDRVLAPTRFSGQAELVTVPATDVLALPPRLSFEDGAALLVTYATAYAALVIMGGTRAGDRVLIHSAGGGVGVAAVQLARWVGAEVLGIASAAKHERLREHGIDHVIDRSADFEREVRRLTHGEGVDVVVDATSPRNFRKDYRLLRPGGRLVLLGLADAGARGSLARAIPVVLQLPLSTLPWWKGHVLLKENRGVFGLNLLTWWDREQSIDRLAVPVMRLAASGEIAPVVGACFSFADAGDAHRLMHARRNFGKVVLVP